MLRDQMSSLHIARAISPAAATTDNTAWVSQIIDTQGYGSLTFAINLGALADADATFAVTMHHGDDSSLSDAAAVSASDLVGTLALAGFQYDDDNEVRKVGYVGGKRYVRLTITPSNNTGNAFVSAVAILGHPAIRPTANPPV